MLIKKQMFPPLLIRAVAEHLRPLQSLDLGIVGVISFLVERERLFLLMQNRWRTMMLGAAKPQQFSKLAVSHRCRRVVCPGVIL